MIVKSYRKKPVVVEAVYLYDANAMRQAAQWCGGKYRYVATGTGDLGVIYWVDIPTLEGVMRGIVGDYIIRGVQGEFYPCKPDIFAKTHEEYV